MMDMRRLAPVRHGKLRPMHAGWERHVSVSISGAYSRLMNRAKHSGRSRGLSSMSMNPKAKTASTTMQYVCKSRSLSRSTARARDAARYTVRMAGLGCYCAP